MKKILDWFLSLISGILFLPVTLIVILSISISSCNARKSSPYGVKWTNTVAKKDDINLTTETTEIGFRKGAFSGVVTLKYDLEKADYIATNVEFSAESSEEETVYNEEIAQECIQSAEKYYFVYYEKMFAIFPPTETVANNNSGLDSILGGNRYYTFRKNFSDNSYIEYRYTSWNNYLILNNSVFHCETPHDPVLTFSHH